MSHSKYTKLPRNNVSDRFKGLTIDEIKPLIYRYPMALGTYCVQYDINAGVMIRNSNAFACQYMVLVGKKKYDRRSSVGTQNYENIVHCVDTGSLLKWLEATKYTLVGVDYVAERSVGINTITEYPKNPFFLMGSERNGLPQQIIEACKLIVHIPQFGSVRSLNVGVASGIILNDWHMKNE